MKNMPLKKLTFMALLTAIALTIFLVEAQIPAPVPIPGIKLGLSNIVTVYAIFALGPAEACMILLVRVVLGCLCSGQVMALLYSLAGGVFCLAAMLLLRRFVTERQIWVCSVVGAMFHNLGQILAAILITRTPALIVYLPVLVLSGLIAGLFTGLAAQFLLRRLDKRPPGRP